MRKIWKDKFTTGDGLRESFDDVDAIVAQETKKDALYVNFGSVGVPISVQHKLNKIPVAFILTESESAAIIYSTATDHSGWTDKKIVLRSNTAGRFKVVLL